MAAPLQRARAWRELLRRYCTPGHISRWTTIFQCFSGPTSLDCELRHSPFSANHQPPLTNVARRSLELQHFHLAHPTAKDNVMKWNSDLMLPASWRSKTSAQLMFMGQPLNHPYGIVKSKEWQVDVHWEIEIDSGFEEALFDHLVVATYELAFMPRAVGPDYILYSDAYCDDTSYACRLIVDWHRKTHKRVLHLEAVLCKRSDTATHADAATELWARFEFICEGFAAVHKMFRGIRVFTTARLDENGDMKARLETCTRPITKWLPPEPTLSACRTLLKPTGEDVAIFSPP